MNRRWAVGNWLFLRLLAAIHLIAFGSFLRQWGGLIGPQGILPAERFFAAAHAQFGYAAFWYLPSLCWLVGTHAAIPAMALAGVALAVLLFCGIAPVPCLLLLWADYLSLVVAGQDFYSFQWDVLLLEATFLAVFAAPRTFLPCWRLTRPPAAGRWLLWWLLCRLMFLSGAVKLTSGDGTWRQMTALLVHFHTQPLPTPVAWYAEHLPAGLLRLACLVMFVVELGAPLFIWAGIRARRTAALSIIALQALIELTGNYTFFNLLTVALCLPVLDDAFWLGLLRLFSPRKFYDQTAAGAADAALPPTGASLRAFVSGIVAFTALNAIADLWPFIGNARPVAAILGSAAPLHTLNNYGLFRVMTTERPELIFEGSDDGHDWRDYEFPHKPGDLRRRPDFVAPGQPRLDWQLWFAALGRPNESPWVAGVMEGMLTGNPSILALLSHNPFPAHPPRYLRVVRYIYTFSNPEDRKAHGRWWERVFNDFYVGSVMLPPPE